MPSSAMTLFFFFNDTATTEIYTLSLHDALPILTVEVHWQSPLRVAFERAGDQADVGRDLEPDIRSEEHTSELQSQSNLVCRLLLEKKNTVAPRGTIAWRRLISGMAMPRFAKRSR